MSRFFLFLFFCWGLPASLHARLLFSPPLGAPDTSAERLKLLEAVMAKGGYITAVQELEAIRAVFPHVYPANVLLAKSYLALKQYPKAEEILQKVAGVKAKKSDPFLRFHLAYAQFRQGKKAESLAALALFESSRPPYQAGIWAEMKLMKMALQRKDTLATSPERFYMDATFQFPNSGYADFSPIPLGDSAFLFSSLRHDSLVEFMPGQANFNTIQLYQYTVRPGGKMDEIEQVKALNVPGYHVGNGCFSADRKRFFFSRCTDGPNGRPKCAIYEAEVRADGSFHRIRRLSDRINRRKFSASQPFFAKINVNGVEQEVLYFVSNRRGGFGKNDIWFSPYFPKKKRFGAAVNAGFAVNSAGDDECPFLSANGARFYFSSDGFPGFGGKDVYSATLSGLYPVQRQLLAQPVNSAGDDHFFYLSADGQSGYLASNRTGAHELEKTYCCEDIFRFEKTPPPPPVPPAPPVLARVDSTPKIAAIPPAPAPDTLRPKAPVTAEVAARNIPPKLPPAEPASRANPQAEDRRVARVYFAHNSAQLSGKSKGILRAALQEIQQTRPVRIRVEGLADFRGTVAYNRKLAQKRARVVQGYLQKQGLSIPLQIGKGDLSKVSKTKDRDMLSKDRVVEVSWVLPEKKLVEKGR